MNSTAVVLWLANATLDTVGQLAFKTAAVRAADGDRIALARQPILWLGLACYAAELVAWTAFLSLVPLSRGVLLGSVNVVVLMIAGRVLFAERLTRLRIAGAVLVGLGVALVGAGA